MEHPITKQSFNGSLPAAINRIGETGVPEVLYSYWPFESVKNVLTGKELVFVYPGLWNDPFDKMYLATDYTALGFKQPKIYCMRFIAGVENEDTEWKMVADNEEKTIRCGINGKPLCEMLQAFADKNDLQVYFGKVNYELTREEIQSLHLPKGKHFDHFFKDFTLEKYLQILTLKPQTQSYEKEWRIFMVPKKEGKYFKDLLKIPIPGDSYSLLFSNFTIQPFAVKKSNLPNAEKTNAGFYEFVKGSIAETLGSLYPNAAIDHYEPVKKYKPVKRISLRAGNREK